MDEELDAPDLRSLLDEVDRSWSPAEKEELAHIVQALAERRKGVYVLSDDERAAIEEGIAQADRGEFATEEELAADRRRFGL